METQQHTTENAGFVRSKAFHYILVGIGITVIALVIFQAGVFVGFRKASFSYERGERYYRAFGEMERGPMPGMMREEFPVAGGAVGKVIAMDPPLFTIEDRDGTEKIVRTDASTTLREARTTKPVTELREGDMVVIIGTPNDEGEVLAKLIRLMPPLPEGGAMNFPMMKSSDVTR